MKKHIPNTITCLNLISGCIATYWAFQGDYELALLFIVIGAVFDFFDGMVARLLHVSSPIGKELDSLADDITFGFAPSAIVFDFLCKFHTHLFFIPFLAFIMAAFSALRLAKFNLDERQALGFIGLPTPANALFWGALIVGLGDQISTLQDLGLEGQRDKVYFPAYLYSSFTPAWNQRTGSYHCMVCHPICSK